MKTKIIIPSSGTIDLYDDAPISLSYNIADIKEAHARHSHYSKTITVPGTNNNNKMLSCIFEIGIDRLYNPNHKASALIMVDEVQVLKGYMRLDKIRSLRDEKIEYDIVINGEFADIFAIIIDKKISDLTWSDLDHTYSLANITASWSAAIGSNYVYPYIDYGYS